MHIIQTIKELIVLANKAKVLLGITSDSEPVITIQMDSKEQCSITFKSTCFPFFPETGFYTFSESQLNLVADKCRLFVSNLEKGKRVIVEEKELLFEKEKVSKSKVKNTKLPTVILHLNGKTYRYKVLLCDYHKNNPNTRFMRYKKSAQYTCNCKLLREEED